MIEQINIKGYAIHIPKINLIGVELEGGWHEKPEKYPIIHDGSVGVNARYYGEIPSPPMKPNAIVKFIDECYPDVVNSSCGFHVHISTKSSKDYGALMTEAFYLDFVKWAKALGKKMKLDLNHEFYKRLEDRNGYSTYCRKGVPNFMEQVVATGKQGVRYKQLNFCWSQHGTLEMRLMPAWAKKSEAIFALASYLRFVNGWLVKNGEARQIKKQNINLEADFIETESTSIIEEGLTKTIQPTI